MMWTKRCTMICVTFIINGRNALSSSTPVKIWRIVMLSWNVIHFWKLICCCFFCSFCYVRFFIYSPDFSSYFQIGKFVDFPFKWKITIFAAISKMYYISIKGKKPISFIDLSQQIKKIMIRNRDISIATKNDDQIGKNVIHNGNFTYLRFFFFFNSVLMTYNNTWRATFH